MFDTSPKIGKFDNPCINSCFFLFSLSFAPRVDRLQGKGCRGGRGRLRGGLCLGRPRGRHGFAPNLRGEGESPTCVFFLDRNFREGTQRVG